jgi:hypothetical protein
MEDELSVLQDQQQQQQQLQADVPLEVAALSATDAPLLTPPLVSDGVSDGGTALTGPGHADAREREAREREAELNALPQDTQDVLAALCSMIAVEEKRDALAQLLVDGGGAYIAAVAAAAAALCFKTL